MLDALARAHGVNFATLLRDNLPGIRLAEIHPELAGRSPVEFLPARPLSKVIVRHTMLVDFAQLGYALRKCFILHAPSRDMLSQLCERSEINNLLRTGPADGLCEALFADVLAAEKFKEELQRKRIRIISEHDILEEFKYEEFFPMMDKE